MPLAEDVTKYYAGATPVTAIYRGSTRVWCPRAAVPAGLSGGGALSATVTQRFTRPAILSSAGALTATAEKLVWTPNSISGLGLWLDAAQITGLSDGAAIGTWSDASGNNHNAAAIGTPPAYKAAGISGHPAVDFIGDADRSLLVSGWGAALSGKTQYTLFIVMQPRRFGFDVILYGPEGQSWTWLVEFDPAGGIYWGQVGQYLRLVRTTLTLNTPVQLTFSHDGHTGTPPVDSHTYQDGVEKMPESYGGGGDIWTTVPDISAGVRLGSYFNGSYPIDALVGEVLWYDHALTTPERIQIEEYLTDKWGIGEPTMRVLPAPPPPVEQSLPDHLRT